jgi:S1-C subfamily serine protease
VKRLFASLFALAMLAQTAPAQGKHTVSRWEPDITERDYGAPQAPGWSFGPWSDDARSLKAKYTIVDASVWVGTGRGSGSGSCLGVKNGKGIILSCNHVAGPGTTCTIKFPSGRKYQAKTIVSGPADVAVLVFDSNVDEPAVDLADAEPPAGTAAWMVGYPHGVGPKHATGTYDGRSQVDPSCMRTNITAISGYSGGGIFIASGHIVGICTHSWGHDKTNRAIGPSLEVLKQYVAKAKASGFT